MRFLFLLLAVVVMDSCTETGPSRKPFKADYLLSSAQLDPLFDTVATQSIGYVDLTESSGAVVSESFPGCLWVVEDGGTSAYLYLVETASGAVIKRIRIEGVVNQDWEELAEWRDASGKRWLVIGDIGDNEGTRNRVQLYCFHEPKASEIEGEPGDTVEYEPSSLRSREFSYADGPRDAESLFIHPVTGQIFVVSKREAANRVYVLPWEKESSNTDAELAQFRGEIPLTYTTGAAARLLPSGGVEIAIRTYESLYRWEKKPRESIEHALQRTPTKLPYKPRELQGEIFAWSPQGDYFLLSERVFIGRPKVLSYRRK